MIRFNYKNVFLEGWAVNRPTTVLTSTEIEDKLGEIYKKLGIPFGTLERLTGISSRYVWERDLRPSQVGTVASEAAIEMSGIDKSKLKAIFNCSVVRDYFEPATGCLVHKNLGLDESAIALDVCNACLGFSNGIFFLANLIEAGVVEAGVVVSGENTRVIIDSTMKHVLENPDLSREQLLKILPTFTLGCGAVSFVLCNERLSKKKHKIIGGTTRSATQHAELCAGNADYFLMDTSEINPIMETESSKLIAAAAELGARSWKDASESLGWKREDPDHIICHQVGRQVNDAFYKVMGLDFSKEHSIYKDHGNLVSAAMPTALIDAIKVRNFKAGEKVLLTGFGSGLNSLFLGIEW